MKLKRCLKYLKVIKHTKLTIRIYSLSIVKLWVDVSYNTHDYFKGHNGAMMNPGEGAIIGMSSKKN